MTTLTPLRLALLRRLASVPAGTTWRELEDEGHAPAVIRGAEHCGLVNCGSVATGWRVRLTERGAEAIAPAAPTSPATPPIGRKVEAQLTLF